MTEQQVIDGRKAFVTYMHADWTPASKEDHEMLKVAFEDGEVLFLVRKPKPVEAEGLNA